MKKTEMSRIQLNTTKQLSRLGLALALTASTIGMVSAQTEGTLEIKLGTTVSRTWDDLKKAGYAYGPKQEFDAGTRETHIWLPYGSKGIFSETVATVSSDPEPGKPAMMRNGTDGFTCVRWGYKLRFDKPVSGFRMSANLAELGLKNAVAGVEYSVDGQTWKSVKETDKSGIINKFVDPATAKVSGLKTQELNLRFYSRSKTDPTAASAEGAWFKLWTAGDPSWGDASSTFFAIQPQVWVTAAE